MSRDQNIFAKSYDEFDIRILFECPEDALHFNLRWNR